MGEIKFGTDGWRAVIGEDFTFDNVKKVAQAIADYIRNEGERPISIEDQRLAVKDDRMVVGYDTRFLSDKFAELVACVMAGNGIRTILADRPCPTPSISYAIKDNGLIGGVVITASHNPAIYNGIKYKTHYAGSATLEITEKFESYLGKSDVKYTPLAEAKAEGIVTMKDIIPDHLQFVKRYVNVNLLKKNKFKILVDAMYGAGDSYIQSLLEGGACEVETIHGGINPSFGNVSPEPKMPNLKELADRVRKEKYDIGLATDGDADRLGVALPDGRLMTGHKIIALLLLHLLEDKSMRGDVVQTICGTGLIDKICKIYNLKVRETPVGFKYISEIMKDNDILIGGEETGGIAFKNSVPERDGILSGLLILEMMAMRKKDILDILKGIDKEYGRYEYRRLDVKYPDEKKSRLMASLKTNPPKKILGERIVKIKNLDGYKFICEDSSWLMLRSSGTEPMLRVYAEASSEKKALDILAFGKELAYSV